MITRLAVKGFRALKDFALDVPRGVPVVLVGANGTGKTTILEVFDFLRDLADSGGAPRAFLRRGGFDAVVTRGGDGRLELTIEYGFVVDAIAVNLRYRLAFASVAHGGWRVEADELDLLQQGAWVEVARNNPDRKVYREDMAAAPVALRIERNDTLLSAFAGRTTMELPGAFLLALVHLRYVPSFEVRATWARRPGDAISRTSVVTVDHATELDAHGLNLLNVLHTLSSDLERRALWDRLLGEFQREFPYVHGVSFPASGGGRRQVVMKWRDARSGQWMFFEEMSDGMVVYLTLLTSMLTSNPLAALAFDEPDLHMHPSVLARVVENLEDCAERRTVFVATHSDRLLDFLSEPARSIHVVEHDAVAGVIARRLDAGSLAEWLSKYRVSELRHMGMLDRIRTGGVRRVCDFVAAPRGSVT